MIIVRFNTDELYYVASTKALPELVQQLKEDAGPEAGVESIINLSEYFQFNVREARSGCINDFRPLSELVVVNCGLAKQETTEDEEE